MRRTARKPRGYVVFRPLHVYIREDGRVTVEANATVLYKQEVKIKPGNWVAFIHPKRYFPWDYDTSEGRCNTFSADSMVRACNKDNRKAINRQTYHHMVGDRTCCRIIAYAGESLPESLPERKMTLIDSCNELDSDKHR